MRLLLLFYSLLQVATVEHCYVGSHFCEMIDYCFVLSPAALFISAVLFSGSGTSQPSQLIALVCEFSLL